MIITVNMGLCGYGNEWEEDVEVTEQEYERLEKALSTGRDFSECEDVKDIYDRIVDIADNSATEHFYEDDSDIAQKFNDDKNLKASDMFPIWIECYEFEAVE